MTAPFAKCLIAGSALLALASCGGQDEADATYEAGVTDQSGGELIVSTPDPNAVPVKVPDTPMTPVPDQAAGPTPAVTSPARTPSPAASPTPTAAN